MSTISNSVFRENKCTLTVNFQFFFYCCDLENFMLSWVEHEKSLIISGPTYRTSNFFKTLCSIAPEIKLFFYAKNRYFSYFSTKNTLSKGISRKLTFTTLWAFSADDKLMIFFLFFPVNRIWHFMQIVSWGDNLHEMSNPVFWEKQEKYFKMLSAENFTQSASLLDTTPCSEIKR